jgi:glycosyltransferase involved in cell wall biosynthesis
MANMLSACLIVKDEESCIERCLKSVRNHADEIVVVDTGSSDNTVKLSKKYADRIESFKWNDDFSAARNFSLECAKHDFVFVIDADETVKSWDEKAVAGFIEKNDKNSVGSVEIISMFDDDTAQKKNIFYANRLFNRRYFRYSGTIHEQISNLTDDAINSTDVKIALSHSGYTSGEIARKNKIARNIGMLKKALEQNAGDCYLLFQLGKSYEMDKNYAEALNVFKKAVDIADNFNLLYVRELVTEYGNMLIKAGKFKEALVLEKYHQYYDSNPDYNFVLAYTYMMNGMFSQSVETFLKCTRLTGGSVEGVSSWMPYYNIGVIYECLGIKNEALGYYAKCCGYPPAEERIKALMKK